MSYQKWSVVRRNPKSLRAGLMEAAEIIRSAPAAFVESRSMTADWLEETAKNRIMDNVSVEEVEDGVIIDVVEN